MVLDSSPFTPYSPTESPARLASWYALAQKRIHGNIPSTHHTQHDGTSTTSPPPICQCPPNPNPTSHTYYRVSSDAVDSPDVPAFYPQIMPQPTYEATNAFTPPHNPARDLQILIALNAIILVITLFVSFRTLGMVSGLTLPTTPSTMVPFTNGNFNMSSIQYPYFRDAFQSLARL